MSVSELFQHVHALSPERPLRALWRHAGNKLRPPRPLPFRPRIDRRQAIALASGEFRAEQLAVVLAETRSGPVPTIVLGGFVPDATESVYLLRGMLLHHGSVYYFNYPRAGFSSPLLLAQLEDLIDELNRLHKTPPVIVGISFGCGLLLEWLHQCRRTDRRPDIRGLLMISPVACVADVIDASLERPGTLLGRAVRPFLVQGGDGIHEREVDRCRTILLRMFESGAQNRRAVRSLLGKGELTMLRQRVMATLKSITARGAQERIGALARMESPDSLFLQAVAPLSDAPTLILFAEKESSVLIDGAPSLRLHEHGQILFPSAQVRVVVAPHGSPVQHASLIFHAFNFLPSMAAFYRRLRKHAALEHGRFRLLKPRAA